MFEKIIALIEKYPRIIIHRHQKPDGDALGSQMGLLSILRDNYPQKEIFAVGDMTARYAFMATQPMNELSDGDFSGALSIILDTSAKELISDQRYALADKSARIDHHLFVEEIADEEVTDPSFESCCGLIAAMAMEAGLSVSPDAAKSLYTGMVTDSGRFRYGSTSANTFRCAAFLIEKGFDTADIYRNLYSDDLFFIQLRAKFTLKIQTTPHKVAYIYTTKQEADSYGADVFTLSRGMVNVMSEIKGIESWVNFTETDTGVLCELRSSLHNINAIAVNHGGGGHKMASGATLRDKNEAMLVIEELNALSADEKENI